ncbi:sigma-54-dependent Fis family transcriptional regulator [Mucilaginibacter conchicola]|uniref:Sigma-54-dependent Fis family transcriptional regulator n=1 Tax=Mucilaginibacter conchicola TaxID=2303333 RepID=A0A372NRN8_9SPHI|nr:sigma-54 dependent transcriptional regulator [Mucilaginibacter conchicola]RFZ90933.1 sigma-54-dependent Fis family transcriptional regulator [Mucilaginibacter conchicola]
MKESSALDCTVINISTNKYGIEGSSIAIQKVLNLVAKVSPTQVTVLVLGETGTGKELVARALHERSDRAGRPFIKVNCAALPANLIESELFGHERGSFTGAYDKRVGKFEAANRGTLFLDEIGEMPLDLQVKLLRAIQEKEIERIGGRSVIKTDVRLIAATNRDLELEVQAGRFRSDLFFRLNVFPIVVPPLRERRDDILQLANHFIAKFSGNKKPALSRRAGKQLEAYEWPGNVRELEHLIERTLVLNEGTVINEIMLPGRCLLKADPSAPLAGVKTIAEVEREHILSVLRISGGKISGPGGAAVKLNIPSTTLYSKMKKLKIKKGYYDDGPLIEQA